MKYNTHPCFGKTPNSMKSQLTCSSLAMNIRELLVIIVLIHQVLTSTHHCHTKEKGQLVKNTGTIVWQIPINVNTLEGAIKTLEQDLGKSDNDNLMMTYKSGNKTINIPTHPSESITLARSKCLAKHQNSATMNDILSSKVYEKYRVLSSISYFMKKEKGLTCSLVRQQSGDNCWIDIEKMAGDHNLKIDIDKMKEHMKEHTMGILKVKNNQLEFTTDPDTHILPCIGETKERTKTKWGVLKEAYLKPHYRQVSEKFKNLKRQLEEMEKQQQTKTKRGKRSLFSSIFGLAGASETKELRKALKTELSNQQEMASNIAGMLRSQIQVAERIEDEHKILFKIKKEEEKLETSLKDITIYLEQALANTSDANTENHQDITAIMRFVTINERIRNMEKMIDTITDIIHCPFSRCVGILDDIMARNNIGSPDTYLMIAEHMRTQFEKGKVKVILKNITVQSDKIMKIRCIPFRKGQETVKMNFEGQIAIGTQGYFQISTIDCQTSHGQTLCENIVWYRDTCLDMIFKDQPMKGDKCKDHLIVDNTTRQDFIYNTETLEIFSREKGDITIQAGSVEFKSKLHSGTNVFKLGNRMYNIKTDILQFSFGKSLEVTLEGSVTMTPQNNTEMEGDIARIDIRQLVEFEQEIPHLSLNLTTQNIEINKTLPHPAVIFLTEPEKSWYVYLIILLAILCPLGIFIYCKLKHSSCTNRRQVREISGITPKGDIEEKIELIQVPHANMAIIKHGFCNEITASIEGQIFYWTGSNWKNTEGSLVDGIKEPPFYLRTQLSTHNGGLELSFKNQKPYIHLKGYKNTIWDKQKNMYCIEEQGKVRTLPEYTAQKPDDAILKLLTQAEAEYRVTKK